MNVEQLISEGKEKHNICEVNSSRAFEAGVRHAIAAMFEVVKVEELNRKEMDGGYVWVKFKGDWMLGELIWDEEDWIMFCSIPGREVEVYHDKCEEFRRCPTPGDVGIENGQTRATCSQSVGKSRRRDATHND